ncbi:protein of unknown function [Hyphomicrobium sp. 1Nfss2.1]
MAMSGLPVVRLAAHGFEPAGIQFGFGAGCLALVFGAAELGAVLVGEHLRLTPQLGFACSSQIDDLGGHGSKSKREGEAD